MIWDPGKYKMAGDLDPETKYILERVSPTKTTVLLQGESGTGKQLIARHIYLNSPRQKESFVTVDCGALKESLIESELYGHEKGAFTGATEKRIGKFEQANYGTLFLDEIGELPYESQTKLLRFLQEGVFERLGGSKTLKSDVRIIVATNQNLENMIASKDFRQDLYYRLNVFDIHLLPLRQRKQDIPELTDHFIEKYLRENKGIELQIYIGPDDGKTETKNGVYNIIVKQEFRDILQNYNWPGNIRQLENAIIRAVTLSDDVIGIESLPKEIRDYESDLGPVKIQTGNMIVEIPDLVLPLKQLKEEFEAEVIKQVFEASGWNKAKTGKVLGEQRTTMTMKMKKYGIKRPFDD